MNYVYDRSHDDVLSGVAVFLVLTIVIVVGFYLTRGATNYAGYNIDAGGNVIYGADGMPVRPLSMGVVAGVAVVLSALASFIYLHSQGPRAGYYY